MSRADGEGLVLRHKPYVARPKLLSPANMRALTYGLMNIVSASGIVFANKAVFNIGFHFTYALTWIHTVFTLLGMLMFAKSGLFEVKQIPQSRLVQLAVSYVAYIVLCNLSLKINTVGFYQVMKIAVAPTVLALDFLMFGKLPGPRIIASVSVVCLGIAIATVTDSKIIRNVTGIFVGVSATVMTALYQIWAGTKQKDLRASSMQLLHAYTPQAAVLLGLLVPLCENMGWRERQPGSLLGFQYTWGNAAAILISAALGLLVSLSTFLVIGATSSLTYNVVGHLKTVIILTGGCLFFGDDMPPKKLFGVSVAMCGIIWYTQLKMAMHEAAASSKGPDGSLLLPLLPTVGTPNNRTKRDLMSPGQLDFSAYPATSAFQAGLSARSSRTYTESTNGSGLGNSPTIMRPP